MEKNYCSAHPKQIITNFCRRKQCLKELCPICVCSHTQKHEIMRSLPEYQPINQTIKNCKGLIQKQIHMIESSKNGVAQYRIEWQKRKNAALQKIGQAEKQAVQTVLQTFDEIRSAFNSRIQVQQARIGLKDNYKISNIMNIYDEQIERLHMYHQELSSQSKLHYVKTLLKQVLPANHFLVNSLSKDFSKMLKNKIILNADLLAMGKSMKNYINYNVNFRLQNPEIRVINNNSSVILSTRRQPFRPTSNIIDNNQSLIMAKSASGQNFFFPKPNVIVQKPLLKTSQSVPFTANTQQLTQENHSQNTENIQPSQPAQTSGSRPASQSRSNSNSRRSSIFNKTSPTFKALQ